MRKCKVIVLQAAQREFISDCLCSVNYVWRGDSKEVHPELYVQTQLETLRLGNSTLSAQCSEEGGTKVVSPPVKP